MEEVRLEVFLFFLVDEGLGTVIFSFWRERAVRGYRSCSVFGRSVRDYLGILFF